MNKARYHQYNILRHAKHSACHVGYHLKEVKANYHPTCISKGKKNLDNTWLMYSQNMSTSWLAHKNALLYTRCTRVQGLIRTKQKCGESTETSISLHHAYIDKRPVNIHELLFITSLIKFFFPHGQFDTTPLLTVRQGRHESVVKIHKKHHNENTPPSGLVQCSD